MKYGIALGALPPRLWVEVTEAADRLGFESVWMPEHLVLPVEGSGSPFTGASHPPVPPEVPVFDVFTYFGFLAARTRRIRFGTHVYNIGLRHPFSTARAVTTLDVLSGGRFEFGVGASWLREEWEATGLDFESRGRRVDEALEVCRKLWRDQVIEHHGEFFRFEAVRFEPKPAQAGGPRVHVGGDSPAALRRAAILGDGWIPMNHSVDELPAALSRMASMRAAAGIPGVPEVTLGGSAACADEVRRYRDAGVTRMLVRPWKRSGDALESLQRFAEQVLHPTTEEARR